MKLVTGLLIIAVGIVGQDICPVIAGMFLFHAGL